MTLRTIALKTLQDVGPADRAEVGGKAYTCARLKQAGFPVPDGLIVPADADADLSSLVDHPWFARWPPATTFAVRSSGVDEDGADHSFAGIHETYLHVDRAAVLAAVEGCRVSGRSIQAASYRRAEGLSSTGGHIAVLIQPMIAATAAGVAFTANPISGAADELVINASWGVGEQLVSGLVDPDDFRVRKTDGAVLSTRIGRKDGRAPTTPSLTVPQLAELALLLVSIEQHEGRPQDVEWGHDGTRFWILQSRPITTRAARSTEVEWTRANLVEVLPELTSPQALFTTELLLNIAERRYMGRLLAPDDVLGPMFKSFCGRLYLNLDQLRRLCRMSGTAPSAALRSLGHPGTIRPDDEIVVRPPIRERLPLLPDFLRVVTRHLRARHLFRAHKERTDSFVERLSPIDPATRSDEELCAIIAEWEHHAPEVVETILVFGGVMIYEEPLRKICARVGYPVSRLLYSHLAAGERSVSAQQAFDLVALADRARQEPRVVEWFRHEALDIAALRRQLGDTAFVRDFDRFLRSYGHRGLYESDWALPRYSEDPTPLLQAIRLHLASGEWAERSAPSSQPGADAKTSWADFVRLVPLWQRPFVLPQTRALLTRIKQYYLWREACRSNMVRVLAVLRRWHLALAARLHQRGWLDDPADYFMLHFDEVRRATAGELDTKQVRAIVAERRRELELYRRVQMPLLMRESELPLLIRAASVGSATDGESELRGLPVSGGCIEADIVVLDRPGDVDAMKRGAILVARATDPSWTPLFTLASGVITEVGGVLSHASTIAREYGLPALANVDNATRRLRTGERVRLDADNGIVYRISPR